MPLALCSNFPPKQHRNNSVIFPTGTRTASEESNGSVVFRKPVRNIDIRQIDGVANCCTTRATSDIANDLWLITNEST
jgi:hypothetical protein